MESPIRVPPEKSRTAVSRFSAWRYDRPRRASVTRVSRVAKVNVSTRPNTFWSA